jgi:hypothetical protein
MLISSVIEIIPSCPLNLMVLKNPIKKVVKTSLKTGRDAILDLTNNVSTM